MALDMAKYRRIFIEEATDHLGEISVSLLALEKETTDAAAIDTIFRMAHSIKSMAASLGFDVVADLAHRIEDRMEGVRSNGRVRGADELALLFRGLEALESMVGAVAADEDLPSVDESLLEALSAPPGGSSDGSEAEAAPRTTPDPEPRGGEPKKVRS